MDNAPVRLLRDQVMLELEPESDKYSGVSVDIFKVSDKDTHVFRAGRVVQVGPGADILKHGLPTGKLKPIGVEVGKRYLFVKYVATHTKQAQSIQQIIGEGFAIVKANDLLLELDEDFDMGTVSQ